MHGQCNIKRWISFFSKNSTPALQHTETHRQPHTHRFDPTVAQFIPSYTNPNTNSKAYCLSIFFGNTHLILLLPSLSLPCLLPFIPSFCLSVSLSLLCTQTHSLTHTRTHTHKITHTHTQRVCLVFQLKQRLSWSHAKFQLKNVNQARQINTRLAPLDRAHAHMHIKHTCTFSKTHTL